MLFRCGGADVTGHFFWNKAPHWRLFPFMTKTRYYIASGLENAAAVQDLKKTLDDAGWHHTYDWTVHGKVPHDWRPKTAAAESDGVLTALVVIGLLPGGRGTHTEIGMAIGQVEMFDFIMREHMFGVSSSKKEGRRIVLYSPDPERDFGANSERTCVFYHHPLVERFSSMAEMITSLLGAT